MLDAYIYDGLRTPFGRHAGALAPVRPDDLLADVIRALIARNPFDPALIEDVVAGNTNQAGEDCRNVARNAALISGLPQKVGGLTVNRLCGSGLAAVMDAGRAIRCGEGDMFIAGGVESMSRAPLVMSKATSAFDRGQQIEDSTIGWRFPNKALLQHIGNDTMPQTAENVAERIGITREESDTFAAASHQRAAAATKNGLFDDEIVPVPVPQRKGDPVMVTADEGVRGETTADGLGKLRPAFDKAGNITAGNASQISDGASAMVIVSAAKAEELGAKGLGEVVGYGQVSGPDASLLTQPSRAIMKALDQAGISKDQIGLYELNEAFAAVGLASMDELGITDENTNVNGGAISIGHPLGASGNRITLTLLLEMQRRGVEFGAAGLCGGGGQGDAIIVKAR